jgi:hypothetical protein
MNMGLTPVPSGLPEDRLQFEMGKHFKVIQKESSIKDEDWNDRIQKEGVHYWGGGAPEQLLTGSETEWYMRHKG